MTSQINSLVLDALDNLNHIVFNQKLLEIAQEEVEKRENDLDRIDILLEVFLSRLECHTSNLRAELTQIQKIIRRERNNHCQRSQPEDEQEDYSQQTI